MSIMRVSLSAALCFAGIAFSQDFAPAPRPMGFAFATAGGSYLGVNVQEIDSARARSLNLKEERGVEITMVADESPAAKGGLRKGDVVLEYNGQRVEGTEQFVRLVRETPAGRQVRIGVWREGALQTIPLAIGTRRGARMSREDWPAGALVLPEIHIPDLPRPHMSWRSQSLGVEAESLDGQLASFFGVEKGVLVRGVVKGSAAEKAGLKAGDVITKVGDKAVESPSELTRELRPRERDEDRAGERTVTLTVVREKKEMTVKAVLGGGEARTRQQRELRRPVRRIVEREQQF
jgi:serine protease Do